MVSVEAIADLQGKLQVSFLWAERSRCHAHMFGFIADAICDALFEALQILMDVPLFFKDQHCAGAGQDLYVWSSCGCIEGKSVVSKLVWL